MERETRIELATNSLEGCDSTIELLPPGFVHHSTAALRLHARCGENAAISSRASLLHPAQCSVPQSSRHRSCKRSPFRTDGPRTTRASSTPSDRRSPLRCPARWSASPSIGSPASSSRVTCSGDSLRQDRLLLRGGRSVDALVHRLAELRASARGTSRPDPCPCAPASPPTAGP